VTLPRLELKINILTPVLIFTFYACWLAAQLSLAQGVLDLPAKWNHRDTRVCKTEARTFSLYCALERASEKVTGHFEHRAAALQETRFVIDEIAADRNYEHRLMGYNSDPRSRFKDIRHVLQLV
jgi:hypothetical protein